MNELDLYIGKNAVIEVLNEAVFGVIEQIETVPDQSVEGGSVRIVHLREDPKTLHKMVFVPERVHVLTDTEAKFAQALSSAVVDVTRSIVKLALSQGMPANKDGLIMRLLTLAVMSTNTRSMRKEVKNVRGEASADGG